MLVDMVKIGERLIYWLYNFFQKNFDHIILKIIKIAIRQQNSLPTLKKKKKRATLMMNHTG